MASSTVARIGGCLVLGSAVLLACKSDGGVGTPGAGGVGGGGLAGASGSGQVAGSGGSSDADGATAFSRTDLLTAFGTCAFEGARDFRQRATALEAATAALVATPEAATTTAAREAYQAAMDAWQIMETMQFGPTAPRLVPGGQGFRDEIYAWPAFGRCAVEEGMLARAHESATTLAAQFVSARGLGALEYLLFYEGSDSSCSGASLASWNALSVEERASRKRAYAAAAARDIAKRAAALEAEWDPDGGNFVQTLRAAGSASAVYSTTQVAFNSVSDAAFYMENQVKDMKLAQPLGMDTMVCFSPICPELLESQYAGRSKANVRSDLNGTRRLLEGCGADHTGLGFDDLLTSIGQGDMATRLRERAIAVEAAVDAISDADLRPALVSNKSAVDALYLAIKNLTDILKTEFVMVLDLRLPADTLGDND